MDNLTNKQKKVFKLIQTFFEREKRSPTTRELAAELNCHIKTVYQYLQVLDKKGMTERRNGRIFITKPFRQKGLPILGKVAAGTPILAEENYEGFLSLDDFYGKSGDFVLRIHGDSMVNAHICDGDHVIVDRQQCVENGEIGVALIDCDATVKRIRIDGNKIQLIPENDAYDVMEYDLGSTDVRVLGKVIGVVRNF